MAIAVSQSTLRPLTKPRGSVKRSIRPIKLRRPRSFALGEHLRGLARFTSEGLWNSRPVRSCHQSVLDDEAELCPFCGAPLKKGATRPRPKPVPLGPPRRVAPRQLRRLRRRRAERPTRPSRLPRSVRAARGSAKASPAQDKKSPEKAARSAAEERSRNRSRSIRARDSTSRRLRVSARRVVRTKFSARCAKRSATCLARRPAKKSAAQIATAWCRSSSRRNPKSRKRKKRRAKETHSEEPADRSERRDSHRRCRRVFHQEPTRGYPTEPKSRTCPGDQFGDCRRDSGQNQRCERGSAARGGKAARAERGTRSHPRHDVLRRAGSRPQPQPAPLRPHRGADGCGLRQPRIGGKVSRAAQ